MASIKEKRKKIQDYVVSILDTMDTKKESSKYFLSTVGKLSDKEFSEYMEQLKQGKVLIKLFIPNFKAQLDMDTLLKLAKQMKVKLYHQLEYVNPDTKKTFVTPTKFLLLRLPIRRTQQTVEHEISVAEGTRRVDMLTGQVSGDDQVGRLSNPEIHVLQSRNLSKVLQELVQVRGGDITNTIHINQQLEETGEVSFNDLDPNTRTRSSVILGTFLRGMGIDNNLVGDDV